MAKFHVILNVKKGKIGTFDIFFPLSTEHSLFVSLLGSHGHDISIRVIKEELRNLRGCVLDSGIWKKETWFSTFRGLTSTKFRESFHFDL